MANTTETSPGTVVNDTAVGNQLWNNPNNAKAADSAFAQSFAGDGFVTNYLKATNFSFSIPAGATIDGILVEVEKQGFDGGNAVVDGNARIVKSDGSLGTENKADTTDESWTFPASYYSYGSSTDLWGETWTASDINDADFGFAINANGPSSSPLTMYVGHIRITVYYTSLSYNPAFAHRRLLL